VQKIQSVYQATENRIPWQQPKYETMLLYLFWQKKNWALESGINQ